MSDMAKKARAAMKAKAKSLAEERVGKVDSSDWTPPEAINAEVKTGMRPISRRAFKKGGKVEGEASEARADRKPRKGEKAITADSLMNRDMKEANEEREGIKHVGGMKKGGRAKKQDGGPSWAAGPRPGMNEGEDMTEEQQEAARKKAEADRRERQEQEAPDVRKSGGRTKKQMGGAFVPPAMRNAAMMAANSNRAGVPGGILQPTGKGGRPIAMPAKKGGEIEPKRGKAQHYEKGGKPMRMQRKDGGRTKKPGVNVNVIVTSKPDAAMGAGAGAPGMPPRPPGGVPVPVPPPGMPAGLPAGMPPAPGGMPPGGLPPAPGGMPPLPRKRGGKVYRSYKDMDAGAGSGEGRLEKTEIQKRKR